MKLDNRPARVGSKCPYFLRWLVAAGVLALPVPVAAAPPDLCDLAAAEVGYAAGIPVPVLRAMTRAETGRNRNGRTDPWPWTVSRSGKAHFFASKQEAETFLHQLRAKGVRNFDVGCFQISYRWHGAAFPDLAAMLDPEQNAAYAATLLQSRYRRTRNWSAAAGAYHSRNQVKALAYMDKFDRIRADLPPTPVNTDGRRIETRGASVAALDRGPLPSGADRPGPAGSLVRLGSGAKPLFVRE